MNTVILSDIRGHATFHPCATPDDAARLACALTASIPSTTATVEQPDGRTFIYDRGAYQGEVGHA